MAICNPNCDVIIPPLIECPDEFRNGGISRLFFIPCWLEFYDIKDVAEWCEYYNSGLLVFTAPILGQKPKATMFKRRISSCNPEKVIGKTNSVKFQDFNADDVAFSDYDFWNTIMDNPHRYQMGFMDCNDLFYGFFQDIVLDIDDIIEDSSNGLTFWDGSIDWNGYLSTAPTRIPLLLQTLLGDCTNVPPSPPSCCKRWRPVVYASVNIVNSQVADVIVTFDECVDADFYTIEVIVGNNPPQIFTNITGSPYTIHNIPQGQNVIISLYSTCSNGLTSTTFTTTTSVPTWPCCAPLNGTNNFRITNVAYNAPNFEITFELDLATGACLNVAETFISYKYGSGLWSQYQGPFSPVGNLVTGTLIIPDTSSGHTVSFRYYNDCGMGNTSATVQSNGTWNAPECCPNHRFNILITQQVNATDVDVTVMWDSCPDALEYYIRYSENGGPFTAFQMVLGNSITFPGLLQGADYEFEVYAQCLFGQTKTTSKTIPTGVPPCCTVQSFDLDLGNIVTGPTHFTIPYTVTQSSGVCVPPVNTEFRWKRTTGGVFSAWATLSGGIISIPISESGHPLTIEVRNDCGGIFSNVFTTSTTPPCCAPTNLSIVIVRVDATSVEFEINWVPCYGPGVVEVTYQRNGDPSPIPLPGSPFSSVPATTISVPINSTHTSIDISARTQCSSTNISNWVTTSNPISRPCCAPILQPTPDTAVTKDQNFIYIPINFTPDPGACDTITSFTLEWRVAPSGLWTSVPNFVSGTNLQIPIIHVDETIDVRIIANCPSGISVPSNTDSVHTGCCGFNSVSIVENILGTDIELTVTGCTSNTILYYFEQRDRVTQVWSQGTQSSVPYSPLPILIPIPSSILLSTSVDAYRLVVASECTNAISTIWQTSNIIVRNIPCCVPLALSIASICEHNLLNEFYMELKFSDSAPCSILDPSRLYDNMQLEITLDSGHVLVLSRVNGGRGQVYEKFRGTWDNAYSCKRVINARYRMDCDGVDLGWQPITFVPNPSSPVVRNPVCDSATINDIIIVDVDCFYATIEFDWTHPNKCFVERITIEEFYNGNWLPVYTLDHNNTTPSLNFNINTNLTTPPNINIGLNRKFRLKTECFCLSTDPDYYSYSNEFTIDIPGGLPAPTSTITGGVDNGTCNSIGTITVGNVQIPAAALSIPNCSNLAKRDVYWSLDGQNWNFLGSWTGPTVQGVINTRPANGKIYFTYLYYCNNCTSEWAPATIIEYGKKCTPTKKTVPRDPTPSILKGFNLPTTETLIDNITYSTTNQDCCGVLIPTVGSPQNLEIRVYTHFVDLRANATLAHSMPYTPVFDTGTITVNEPLVGGNVDFRVQYTGMTMIISHLNTSQISIGSLTVWVELVISNPGSPCCDGVTIYTVENGNAKLVP